MSLLNKFISFNKRTHTIDNTHHTTHHNTQHTTQHSTRHTTLNTPHLPDGHYQSVRRERREDQLIRLADSLLRLALAVGSAGNCRASARSNWRWMPDCWRWRSALAPAPGACWAPVGAGPTAPAGAPIAGADLRSAVVRIVAACCWSQPTIRPTAGTPSYPVAAPVDDVMGGDHVQTHLLQKQERSVHRCNQKKVIYQPDESSSNLILGCLRGIVSTERSTIKGHSPYI